MNKNKNNTEIPIHASISAGFTSSSLRKCEKKNKTSSYHVFIQPV